VDLVDSSLFIALGLIGLSLRFSSVSSRFSSANPKFISLDSFSLLCVQYPATAVPYLCVMLLSSTRAWGPPPWDCKHYGLRAHLIS